MLDLFREIFQTLKCNRMRTALTGLAVSWGIFMLIALVGMTKGVINVFEYNVAGQGTNTLNVWPGRTSEPWHGYRQGRSIELRTTDMDAVINANPGSVKEVTSSIYGGGIVSTSSDYISTGYNGVYPAVQRRQDLRITAGRFINDRDIAERRKVMVLSSQVCEMLFPKLTHEEIVGRMVDCQSLGWTIVGIYESRWNRTLYIPFTTAALLAGNTDRIDNMMVEMENVDTEDDASAVETAVRSTLASVHDFNPGDQSALWIWNRFKNYLQQQTGMSILNYAMWAIGLFTLLSGIIGVSNIMFVSVRERTHEIGVRRAIGAKPRSILTQIIMESIVITALFGYIGIVMGIGFTEIMAQLFENSDFIRNPRINISLALEVTAVLVIAGALAGLFPALNAIKVKPVEALRDE